MAPRPPALYRSPVLLRHPILLAVPCLLFAAAAACAQSGAPPTIPRWQAEASVTHDDNVTRARTSDDIASDQSGGIRLARDWDFALNRNTRLVLAVAGGGDTFVRYTRLSRAFAEAEAVVEYRADGSFTAPTYSLFVRGAAEESRSRLRSGGRAAVGARVAAALTERVFAVASLDYSSSDARSAVFSGNNVAARLSLDYAVSGNGTFYAAVDVRQGDAISSGRESLEAIDIAKVFVADDAFADKGLLTYRFDARTIVAVLGYNQGLGSDMSIDISWRRAETRPRDGLPFVSTMPNRYVANQFVLALLKRF